MATHNTLFQASDVRRHPDGLAISVQLPWYRSLWLSAVKDVAVRLNGAEVARADIRFELDGRTYSVDELPEQCGQRVCKKIRVHSKAPSRA